MGRDGVADALCAEALHEAYKNVILDPFQFFFFFCKYLLLCILSGSPGAWRRPTTAMGKRMSICRAHLALGAWSGSQVVAGSGCAGDGPPVQRLASVG